MSRKQKAIAKTTRDFYIAVGWFVRTLAAMLFTMGIILKNSNILITAFMSLAAIAFCAYKAHINKV